MSTVDADKYFEEYNEESELPPAERIEWFLRRFAKEHVDIRKEICKLNFWLITYLTDYLKTLIFLVVWLAVPNILILIMLISVDLKTILYLKERIDLTAP